MKKGLKDGGGSFFYENGQLWYSGTFVNDQIHGDDCTTYHQNGNLRFLGIFKDGKKSHGKFHYDTGDLWYDGPFIDDKFEGSACKVYYHSGNVKYEGEMKAGKRNGRGVIYTESGKVYRKGIFRDDQFVGAEPTA